MPGMGACLVVSAGDVAHVTALAMLDGPPLLFAGQSSLKFHGRTAVDEVDGGLALDETEGDRFALDQTEGDRIAATLGDADILFMKHHGVMVVGPSVAKAWDDLYYPERAAEVQRLAEAAGRPLLPIPTEIAERTAARMRRGGTRLSADLHLASIKRRWDAKKPEYRQ